MRNKPTGACVENPTHRQFVQGLASVFRWNRVLLLFVLLTVGVSPAQSQQDYGYREYGQTYPGAKLENL